MSKFGIYAWPAYATRRLNPYNYIIYSHIEAEGHPVHEFKFGSTIEVLKLILSRKFKVFHIHWPTSSIIASNKFIASCRKVLLFYIIVKLVRLSGKKIFWTVHNLEEHEIAYPRLTNLMNEILYKNVQGFISMNKAGIQLVRHKCSFDLSKKVSLINHPHYRDYYANSITREEARKILNIPEHAFVFLFLGQIRKYKNVPALVETFKKLNQKNSFLVIAGKVFKDVDLQSLKDECYDHSNILFRDSFVEEEELQVYLNACDLAITPYTKIFNSGSIFLNVSFNRPTLAPHMNCIIDLKDLLGPKWVKTYESELTPEILKHAMVEVLSERSSSSHELPVIDQFDPKIVARDTLEFYKLLLN